MLAVGRPPSRGGERKYPLAMGKPRVCQSPTPDATGGRDGPSGAGGHGLGEAMGQLWANSGTTMGQLWDNYGTTMGQPMGQPMGQLKNTHDSSRSAFRGQKDIYYIVIIVIVAAQRYNSRKPKGM